MHTLKKLFIRASEQLDRIGNVWLWALISLVLLALVVPLNPAKLGAYLWAISKISGAASVGYGVDWAAFRGADPRYLDGIEKAMAQTRRATLVAAAMIAAGLIG
ncbi:putative holin [Vulcaniibacterium tengchongense]|uniref:Uncharacterized protein n=1 Tax=Vulcaniibacterium tengchongense TaxID=1273429 RepID=A0A3N4W6W7_9GAMM|nr:putative holin [Vulcaniibacterium tengchongense]RPE81830.1 hypothetical protein EDC50_1032 [Vulcaniibacterium tengchongense]